MAPPKRGRPATAEAPRPGPEREPAVEEEDDDGNRNSDVSNRSDRDQNSGSDSDPETRQRGAESAEFKFFDTTFSTFRVSPLYIGQNAITPAGLDTLSRRLRDTLVGDVVRGVQVGLESDATLGRLGLLERVEWRECSLEAILPTLADTERRMQGESASQRRRGIRVGRGGERGKDNGKGKGKGRRTQVECVQHLLCLELEYEKATFSALMLPSLDDWNREQTRDRVGHEDEDGDEDEPLKPYNPPSWTQHNAGPLNNPKEGGGHTQDEDGHERDAFARFPLLLTRMPASLKSVLTDFISSTFDCRISPLYLGTRTLIRSWEHWIKESGVSAGKALNKDVALTLGFHLEPSPTVTDTIVRGPAPDTQQKPHGPQKPVALGLKTIDVVVPSEEVRRFLRVGEKLAMDTIDADKGKGSGIGSRKRPMGTIDTERERLRRRRLGGGKDEEGWAWRGQQDPDPEDNTKDDGTETFAQPFTNALSRYLDHHLALDVTHPSVHVLRVVCDAFALSENRMKVFTPRGGGGGGGRDENTDAPSLAIDTFLRNLIRRAQGREWSDDALRLANLRVIA
ncbi:kinetochore complex Sim4 subunit Fta1-domain-containing protein [Xylaria sp. FL1042]|nr:kinetochore complex Sim4 subunit Fta1-domain-containing protein [Xylaria sp. FL1042]